MAYKGAAQHSETRDKVAAALVIIGSLIVAVSGFFVWLDILGSDLTGYQLANLVSDYGSELSGVPPDWVGVCWYLFPALASISWLLVFRHSPPRVRLMHLGMGGALVVGAACYLGFVEVHLGPVSALVGGLTVAGGGVLGQLCPRRSRNSIAS